MARPHRGEGYDEEFLGETVRLPGVDDRVQVLKTLGRIGPGIFGIPS